MIPGVVEIYAVLSFWAAAKFGSASKANMNRSQCTDGMIQSHSSTSRVFSCVAIPSGP